MAITFAPLSFATLDSALALMSAFYREEALDYQAARAHRALVDLLAVPGLGAFHFIQSDAQPMGYFVLTLGFSLEFAGRFALLDEFYVTPEHRGQGAGAQAIGHILRTAADFGVAAIRLEVDRANP